MTAQSDVLVVGGGVMGCAVAWRLAQAGLAVTVLERAMPGAEASTKAAGMLAVQGEAEVSGPFLELCLSSRRRWPDFAGELVQASGVDVGLSLRGVLYPASGRAAAEALRSKAEFQRAQGMRAEILTAEEMAGLEPALSDQLPLGLFAPDDGQVAPVSLSRALHLSAIRAGVRFRIGEVAVGVEAVGGRVRGLAVASGDCIPADAIVVAGGAWTSLLQGIGLMPGSVRPARGQILALATPSAPLRRPVFAGGLGYVLPTQDGRTLVGSTLEMVGFERAVTVAGLEHMCGVARRIVPELAQATVLDHWCGFRPWTPDELPLLGPSGLEGLHLASGHFRSGILLAPISSEVVAAAVVGGEPGVDLTPFRPDRPSLTRTER